MKGHLIIFIVGTLLIQAICLSIYFLAKVDNEAGLIYEILELIPIYLLVTGLFRRCPVCGKRKLTTWTRCGGSRYTLYDAECRKCKSEIGIECDGELHKTTYFRRKNGSSTRIINPIWEDEKSNRG